MLRAELDGMTAIFDRRAGITHMLAEPAVLILDAMQAGAGDAAEIAMRMGLGRDESLAVVTERLDELVATGLVERLDGDT